MKTKYINNEDCSMVDYKLKDKYEVIEISKNECKKILVNYHYLKDKDFLYMFSYGLKDRNNDEIVGAAVFGRVNGISATKGWFGIGNGAYESRGIYELTRLVMKPHLNGGNATSFLLGNALKKARKEKECRAIVSLADTDHHVGYIYQACNFKYYGITDSKTDFYMEFENEKGYKLNPIGKTKDKNGIWLPRSRKHRYAIIYDKHIEVKYKQSTYPKTNMETSKKTCCNNTKRVEDKRFQITYSCPICTGQLLRINN